MNFLLVKTGFILNKLFFQSRLRLQYFLFFFLFISQTGLSQVQLKEITDFVMYGGTGVTVGSSNTINNGAIGSDVLVQSTGNAFIQSNIFSQGRIILTNSNEVTGNIAAANALNSFTGNILDIGSSAVIIGNIDVNGDILIGGGSVTGVITQPDIFDYSGPEPSGGFGPASGLNIPAGPNMPLVTAFEALPYGSTNVTSTSGIDPGAGQYGDISLNGKSTITFNGPGQYVFSSIQLSGNNNKFVFDFQGSTDGKIYIYVHGDVDVGKLKTSIINGGSAERIYAETHGEGLSSKSGKDAWNIANGNGGGSKWEGTIYAPKGSINIGSGTGSTSMTGALWSGKEVVINSGVTLNYAPFELCTPPVVTVSNISICEGEIGQLTASVPGSGYTFLWNTSATTQSIDVSIGGTYSVTVSNPSVGVICETTVSAEVKVNPNPALSAAVATYCVDDIGTFAVENYNDAVLDDGQTLADFTFAWTGGPLNVPADGGSSMQTVYNVTVTDNGSGCTTDATLTITVNPDPALSAAVGTYCVDDIGTFAVENYNDAVLDDGQTLTDFTFAWTGGPLNVPADGGSSMQTVYNATVTDNVSGCTTDATLTITVNPDPSVSDAVDTFCADDASAGFALSNYDSEITGDAGVTVAWFSDSDHANPVTTVTPEIPVDGTSTVNTTYYAVATNDGTGCTTDAILTITVHPDPAVSDAVDTYCADDASAGFALSNYDSEITGDAGVTVTWFSDSDHAIPITTVTPNIPVDGTSTVNTIYYAVATNDGTGCTTDAILTITVNPDPALSVEALTACSTYEGGTTATFNLTSAVTTLTGGEASYSGNGGVIDANTAIDYMGTNGETIIVTATSSEGCTTVESFTLSVNSTPTLTAPNLNVCSDQIDATQALVDLTTEVSTSGGTTSYYINNNVIPNPDAHIASNGDIITVTSNSGASCSVTKTFTISVNSPIIITSVTSDVTSVCADPNGNTAILTVAVSGGTEDYSYYWQEGESWIEGATTVATGNDIPVQPTITTSYTVKVVDNFNPTSGIGCSTTATILVPYSDVCPYYNPTTKVYDLIGSELTSLAQTFGEFGTATSDFIYQINDNTKVLVDIIVQPGSIGLVTTLIEGYVTSPTISININELIITTFFPIEFLPDLNAEGDIINFVRPVFQPLSNGTGLVTQGDGAQRSDIARDKFKLAGTGVKVGVISDSYNKYESPDFAAQDVGSEDLPAYVQITENTDGTGADWDNPYGGTDEGRAMLQIVHDVAPAADLAFRTGFISESDFAQGIYDLKGAGCDIIVDDITYITEPFYKSGLVSQAINDVTAIDAVTGKRVTYFTSAGNFGSNGYEKVFTPSAGDPTRHAFDEVGNTDPLQLLTLGKGEYTIVLQWDDFFYSDEPAGSDATSLFGAEYDFDIYLADDAGNILFGFNRDNTGGDPIEILPFTVNIDAGATTTANLIIAKASGPPAQVNLKYVVFRTGESFAQEYNIGTSTIIGHAANTNAITVAAARYDNLTQVEYFSSRGSTAGLGSNKPDITAPDGGTTTVTSFNDYSGDDPNKDPNFFGTSAAAPHAAGVAALLLDEKMAALNAQVTGSEIKALLAIGADKPGETKDWGAGLIQADKIFESLIAPVGQITNLSYTPDDTPGTILITVTIQGNYLSAGTEIYVDGSALPTGTTIIDNGDGTFTLIGEVDTFLGDPDVQVWSPGIGSSYPRLSEPVSFFGGSETIIISANTDPGGASDANKLFGEQDPTFTVKLLDANLAELAVIPADVSTILTNYLNFNTSGDADWRLDWIAPNYVIEPYLDGSYVPVQATNELNETFDKYNFQFENGQLAIYAMPLTIAAVDVPEIEYGDPIPISFNYIYNNGAGVNWITNKAAMDAELELGYGIDARLNLGILTDMDGIINGGRSLVNGGRSLVNGGRSLVNGGRSLVNGASIIVTESIKNGGRSLVNGLPAALLDEDLIATYDDDPNGGINITFTNGGRSLVNGKYLFEETTLVNGGRSLVNGGRSLVNGSAQVNGGRSLVNGGRSLVNGGRSLVNGAEGSNPNVDLLFILHEDDLFLANGAEPTEDNPVEIKLYPVTFISGIESIYNNEVPDTDHHKIIPAPFISENFIVNTQWGDLVINPKPVTATGAPATSTRVYGDVEDLPTFTTTVVPTPTSPSDPPVGLPYGEQVVSTSYTLDDGSGTTYPLPLLEGVRPDVANYTVLQEVVMPLPYNYAITYVNSTIDITPEPLTITADNKVKAEGEIDPPLTYQVTAGTLYDGLEAVEGSLIRVPEDDEYPGAYPIVEDESDPLDAGSNYIITFVEGTFYINPDGPGTKKLRSSLDCIERLPDKSYIAHFSYVNTNSTAIFVPHGPDNYIESTEDIDPSWLPELFLPGGGVFPVPFNGQRLIWILSSYESDHKTSVSSEASSSSNKCHGNYSTANLTVTQPVIPGQELNLSEEFGNTEVKAYPNPVIDRINIQFNPDAEVDEEVAVYDIQGQLHPVSTIWSTSGHALEVDMSTLMKGEYIIRVKVNNAYKMIRLVKLQ